MTQFVFNIQGLKKCSAIAADSGRIPQFDEDGDLVLPRPQKHLHFDPSESNVILHIGIDCSCLSLSPPVYHLSIHIILLLCSLMPSPSYTYPARGWARD